MTTSKVNRRQFLKVSGVGTGIVFSSIARTFNLQAQAGGERKIIQIRNNYRIGRWFFDPVGLYVQPGEKVRWICTKWGGSVTAFHPSNDNHELRIPEKAKPFDSGLLIQGDYDPSDAEASNMATFDWVFEEEGTYDYFSSHHERLGAVGRIVVGSPGGAGEKPVGYGGKEGRTPAWPDVKKLLDWLSSEKIVREKVVRYPMDVLERSFPLEMSDD
jgi:plastocyanin